jgi:hypothetical protein
MFKQVIKILFLFYCSQVYLFAQDVAIPADKHNPLLNSSIVSVPPVNKKSVDNSAIIKPVMTDNDQDMMILSMNRIYADHSFQQPAKKNQHQDIKSRFVASFRENIHFAGFWDHYAVLNFTPAVNLQPFDFMSINASQNLSCYIPIHGIKEHFGTLVAHGAAILAVDNSVKLFFGTGKMLPSIAGFVLKNIITTFITASFNKSSQNKVYSYNNYYYSMNIRF